MGSVVIAFESVLPLFLIIVTGLLFSRTRVASVLWVDVLNKYALWIGFPALVINSLSRLDELNSTLMNLVAVNSVYIIISILMAYPVSRLLRFSNLRRRTLFMVFAFGNVAYLGIPVLQNTLGDQILPVAAVLASVYIFWLLTLALVLVEVHGEDHFSPKAMFLRLTKNPLLLSVFAGLLMVVFQVKLPAVADKGISMFAGSVTAVVLFSLGVFMGFQKSGAWRDWLVTFAFVILTMVVFPAVYWLFLRKSSLPEPMVTASILDAAMPLGLTPYALSQQYNLDTPFTARLVVLATLLSMAILPVWIALI
ncbi:MAG: AEC family transporter [Bacteroidota bacterium]